jgi:hypothetical protein
MSGNVSEAMRTRILGELDRIEHENNVRIVLAIESGSRAWGFPSPDSDYDVRFLYIRPEQDYLSVFEQREVIERPLDAVLDVNGWDLKKALRLMAGSNAVVLEWLTSPLRYRAVEAAADGLLQAARDVAHLPSFAYHYDRLARRSLGEITPLRPLDSRLIATASERVWRSPGSAREGRRRPWICRHSSPARLSPPKCVRPSTIS